MAAPTLEEVFARASETYETNPELLDEACEKSGEYLFVRAATLVELVYPGYSPEIQFLGKELERAKEMITSGLSYVSEGRYQEALQAFNEASFFAPQNYRGASKEVKAYSAGAVYAHRATVLFHLAECDHCIRDCDLALLYEPPKRLRKRLVLLRAKACLAQRQLPEAVWTLTEAACLLKVRPAVMSDDATAKDEFDELEARVAEAEAEARKSRGKYYPPLDEFGDLSDLHKLDKVRRAVMKHPLKYGAHKTFSCASAGLTLKFSDQYGWHLVAEKHFDVGDIVLVEESCLTFLKTDEEDRCPKYCCACLGFTYRPVPCLGCSSVVYCSASCASGERRKGDVHARECPFWLTLPVGTSSDDAFLPVIAAMRAMLMEPPEHWKPFFGSGGGGGGGDDGDGDGDGDDDDDADADAYGAASIPKHVRFFLAKKERRKLSSKVVSRVSCAAALTMRVLDKAYFVGDKAISAGVRRKLGGLLVRYALHLTSHPASRVHPVGGLFVNPGEENLSGHYAGDVLVVKASRPVEVGDTLRLVLPLPGYDSPEPRGQ